MSKDFAFTLQARAHSGEGVSLKAGIVPTVSKPVRQKRRDQKMRCTNPAPVAGPLGRGPRVSTARHRHKTSLEWVGYLRCRWITMLLGYGDGKQSCFLSEAWL